MNILSVVDQGTFDGCLDDDPRYYWVLKNMDFEEFERQAQEIATSFQFQSRVSKEADISEILKKISSDFPVVQTKDLIKIQKEWSHEIFARW